MWTRNKTNHAYSLLRDKGKSKIDGIPLRVKAYRDILFILSWWELPTRTVQRSWKVQSKKRKQWMR